MEESYYITYHNEDRKERTQPTVGTREDAKRQAEFLKDQGATNVRIFREVTF